MILFLQGSVPIKVVVVDRDNDDEDLVDVLTDVYDQAVAFDDRESAEFTAVDLEGTRDADQTQYVLALYIYTPGHELNRIVSYDCMEYSSNRDYL